jgi:hypothetical protein
MRKRENKSISVSSICAILFSIASFGMLVAAAVYLIKFNPSEEVMMPPSFAFWIYSVIFALISMVFYFIDALRAIARAFKKINPAFNLIIALLFVCAIPLLVFVGAGSGVIIWNAYYVLIFVLEIVSTVKYRAQI